MEKIRILANDGIDATAAIALSNNGFDINTTHVAADALVAHINEQGYKVLIVRSATKVTRMLLEHCPSLALVIRAGVGIDNIDTAAAEEFGVEVRNTPASSSHSVAELVMAHIFSMARMLYVSNSQMKMEGFAAFNSLKKNMSSGVEVRGKVLGILGAGRIGQALATIALGNGMQVMYYDPQLPDITLHIPIDGLIPHPQVTLQSQTMEKILATSDFISLHVPGGKLIGTAEIDKMKSGVCLVNTARGGVIDEQALLVALQSGRVAHAALDVFVNEPTPMPELLRHPHLSVSPHTGASTVEAQERIGLEIAQIVMAYFAEVQA